LYFVYLSNASIVTWSVLDGVGVCWVSG
jgi:hypothetical protein